MTPKILIAAGLVLAFVLGSMATGIYTSTSRAFNPADENAMAAASTVRTAPVVTRTRYVEPARAVVAERSTAPVVTAKKNRTWQKEALIIGGSAGAGAAIGAVAGGKKGAGIGAISGGVAGLVYDLATRNK
jgi:uncharacterized protein YcfJ